MRIYELRQKEVINVCTCCSMGCVMDVDIDPKSGQVLSLIVPAPSRLPAFFGRDNESVIPWRCIRQIGADIILVEMQPPASKA